MLAGSYLDVEEFTERTIAPPEFVAGEFLPAGGARTAWTTFIERTLVTLTSYINARLRKRYAAPFANGQVPEVILGWLTALATPRLYQRRGWDPSDEQAAAVIAEAATAKEELLEAANSETGLYDLPLRQDSADSAAADGTGIIKGGPYSYSEQSPYTWMDRQYDVAKGES